jgi:hypothetical protein
MHARPRGARRNEQVEMREELTKDLVDGVTIQPPASAHGKEWCVVAEERTALTAQVEVLLKQVADPRAEGHEAILPEFGLTNEEHVSSSVEIGRLLGGTPR